MCQVEIQLESGRTQCWINGDEKETKELCVCCSYGGVGDMQKCENELHYDDRELYRSLLREIIKKRSSSGGALKFAKLSKTGKVKKKADRTGLERA
eukprot:IDg5754t1